MALRAVIPSCQDCHKPVKLFKLKDSVWKQIADSTALLCIDCTEKRLGRPITAADLDSIPFVFGGSVNPTPEYDKGILDALAQRPDIGAAMYSEGLRVGGRIARNSSESEIAEFLKSCKG